jgi:CheY-like chemotaxis protein
MTNDKPVFESRDSSAGFSGLRVLLAEDNHITQAMMKMRLARLGCTVTVANNGREAVDMAKEQPFDCILMDYHMPVLDGAAATREIRSWEVSEQKAHPIYISAFTANSQACDRQLLMGAGMDDILTKPMSVPDLEAVLHRASDRR